MDQKTSWAEGLAGFIVRMKTTRRGRLQPSSCTSVSAICSKPTVGWPSHSGHGMRARARLTLLVSRSLKR